MSELESKLERLRMPGPRPELRDEIRRRLSPFRLDRALPWAIAASLFVALFVSIQVREGARAERMAEWTDTGPVSESAKRWAAHLRVIREGGLPNG
jgi:hypothetical protein